MSIPDSIKRPSDFIGPTLISTFIQALEFGILLSQQFTYWSRSENPGRAAGRILLFITLVAFIQMIASVSDLWRVAVTGFGDWQGVFFWSWTMKMQSLLTLLMGMPVQMYLTWRCWMLSGRRAIILLILCPLLITYAAASLVVTWQVFSGMPTGVAPYLSHPGSNLSDRDPAFVVAIVSPAAVDIVLSNILAYQLGRSRSHMITPNLRKILGHLMLVSWEAAIPPCACAITAAVLYLVCEKYNMWYSCVQAMIGKLYVISLLTTLNAKMYLPHLGTTNSFWTPETLPHPRIAKCQCGQVTYTAPKGMVPLEFATLSQTGESVELDSVLGPIGPGYQEIDLASYKTEEDTEYSWWAGSLKIHSLDMLRDTKSVEDSKSSRRKSSASAPS